MALDSFIRDFDMTDISTSTRDNIQANIVSTFYVSYNLRWTDHVHIFACFGTNTLYLGRLFLRCCLDLSTC